MLGWESIKFLATYKYKIFGGKLAEIEYMYPVFVFQE